MIEIRMALLPDEFRRTLGHFATGVTVVTVTTAHGDVHGMTANAFTAVSLEPPLVLVCVGLNARTHGLLPQASHFGISLLRDDQEELARFFASSEPKLEAAERLGVRYRRMEHGASVLADCLARMECTLVASHPAGDHTIFVAQVEGASSSDGQPLLFYRGRFCGLDHSS